MYWTISSCSDNPVSESIIGTWNLLSIEATGCDDPERNIELQEPDENGCITVYQDITCNIFISFSTDGSAAETATNESNTDTDEYSYSSNDDNDSVILCESGGDCETLIIDGDTFNRVVIIEGCTFIMSYKKT